MPVVGEAMAQARHLGEYLGEYLGEILGAATWQMRYLLYAEAGGGLPPHTDLARTECGHRSTHTFILCARPLIVSCAWCPRVRDETTGLSSCGRYLTDCTRGGETVLLEKLATPSVTLASVTPRRGRLLLFPHCCAHRAEAVVAQGLPKLLLRGEMR